MLKNCTAYFEVELYVDSDTITEYGFHPANTLSEAVAYLEEYYGDNLVAIARLELLKCSLIVMKKEMAEQILDYNT